MVRFLDDPEEHDDSAFVTRMDARIGEITALNTALAERERELQLTPAYLLRVMRATAGGSGGSGGGGSGGDMDLARELSLHSPADDAARTAFAPYAAADDDDDMQRAIEQSRMEQ